MVYNNKVALLYRHPEYDLTGSWQPELGIMRFWFSHDPVNTNTDLRWKRREQSVLTGLQNVALTTTVELILPPDIEVVVCDSNIDESEMFLESDDRKDGLALITARMQLPEDSSRLEDTPELAYNYVNRKTGEVLEHSANPLLDEEATGPLPMCAELIAITYPLSRPTCV